MIVVLTCQREGASYVEETLNQIDASAPAGVTKIILSDGPPPPEADRRPGWENVVSPRPIRQPQNKWSAWKAFELAFEAKEDLCFFEDDLLLAKNAAARICEFKVPDDLTFVTFFSPWLTKSQPLGLWRIHGASYIMAQSLKFPLRTCERLLGMRQSDEWLEASGAEGFDGAVRWYCMKHHLLYGIHNPSLVQHVGAVSAVGNGPLKGCRVAENFVGVETDALVFGRNMPEYYL